MTTDGPGDNGSTSDRGHAALARSLAQLTSGWTPVSGVAAEALTSARAALATSLLAGKSLSDIHSTTLSHSGPAPVNPALEVELSSIARQVLEANRPQTIAVVRSATAASLTNPSGRPDWVRGAKIIQSYGPFRDPQGVLHWVDLIIFTRSLQFAFDTPASPFGVFPVRSHLFLPPHPTHLALGAGSVWFLADLFSAALPAGSFTGFTITGGTLTSSVPMNLSGSIYVVPSGATLTATFTLAPAPAPGPGGAGQDAAAATFTPPANVTVVFKHGSAEFQAIDDSVASAYGTTVTLHWNHAAPSQLPNLPALLVPCDPPPGSFAFSSVNSSLFTPSGSAAIKLAGWALPLAATSISSLPEAAGPGSGFIEFAQGVSVAAPLEPAPVPVTNGLIEISTGALFEIFTGAAKPVTTTYELWPLAAPSKLNASVAFTTPKQFVFVFFSSPVEELLLSGGTATAHLDRPQSATGARFPYTAPGLLAITHTAATDLLFIIASNPDDRKTILPVALENALIGVDSPSVIVISGQLSGSALQNAGVGWFFNMRWMLATLPDPYAANFDLTAIPLEPPPTIGTLWAQIGWSGAADPALAFVWLPPAQSNLSLATPFPSEIEVPGEIAVVRKLPLMGPALLDLSTRVDLFGVAVAPEIARLAHSHDQRQVSATTVHTAPALALSGMDLSLNSGIIATFALPQSSWEPMESTANPVGPVACFPPSDGLPLLVCSPDEQQLVPFHPEPVLISNIENVAAGHPFAAVFSLPFGLNAAIIEPNGHVRTRFGRAASKFLWHGGEFRMNRPRFLESFVPSPPPGSPELEGAVQLTLKPMRPDEPAAQFDGVTIVEGPDPSGYGYLVLGADVGDLFQLQFSNFGTGAVPLRRIDFSGYGSSIFSEWNQPQRTIGIIKVQFETSIGRTAHEEIQAVSVIYPYCIHVIRTVTMTRQNAGWVQRTDTGWQAVSPGRFEFPDDVAAQWVGRIHPGAFAGAFNVRNIRDQPEIVDLPPFKFRKVLFDADLGIASSLNVVNGGFKAPVAGIPDPPVLVASRDLIGWLQLAPLIPATPPPPPLPVVSPSPDVMEALFKKTAKLTPTIAASIEAGKSGGIPGTTLRSSAFEVNIITEPFGNPNVPALGVALRGAPQIPRGGGWSLGQRRFTDPAPSALPSDFPLPLVQVATDTTKWHLADVTDVLQLDQPDTFYSLMHSTGTQKVLFELPQIAVGAGTPGLQFPKPGPAKSGGAPSNPGSPNLGDIASILNSTGLFPDIGNALSLLQSPVEQIDTIAQGFKYSKALSLPAGQAVTLIDLGIINIALQYADLGLPSLAKAQQPSKNIAPTAAQLKYEVDSSASPSWTLDVGPLTFLVTVPLFGGDPILLITGGFHADEHANAGLTNLTVQMGSALGMVKDVFNKLQTLAQFLPGGAGAQLDIGLSDGKLTVRDSFSIADLPLGLGDLTDVSLDLGLAVTLQPLSVDFTIGIGSPGNPFNWIVSPLAGNGLMNFGVKANQPSLTIQAGIGLGLAIDLGIASGSASVTIAFQLDVTGNTITFMAILSGQASVDVLDGLASASLTLTAALGFSLTPIVPPLAFSPPLPSIPTEVTLGPETIGLLASCSVGIHISICWVVSISWDGSWSFSQSITTPQVTVSI